VSGPPPAAADAPAALTDTEFAALLAALGPFEPAPRLAVAVSGGPDSMALALLADGWARARGGAVTGLVVDHGLRPESAREAAQACGWLGALGIAAHVLGWTGPKPAAGIQAAARTARLDLLTEACRTEGILHLLLAHQREDQAETVAIREAGGSGEAGLAGMAAIRELHGLRLLRPLLGVPRARLRATLLAAGQPWLEDPSNRATWFARGRLRADPGFMGDCAWSRGLVHAQERTTMDARLAARLARIARPEPLGFVAIAAEDWRALEPEVRAPLLGRLLATVGGRAYPVATAGLRRLAAGDLPAAATLGGCIIMRRRDDLVICRETARIRHRLTLAPGAAALWDGRFTVRHVRGPAPVTIAPLGRNGLESLDVSVRHRLRDARLPVDAIRGLPAAWIERTLIACPPLQRHGLNIRCGFSIETELGPLLPLAPAGFAGVNVVSNPQRPIYRFATASVLVGESVSPASPLEPPRPTSRRTQ
jgi:tRNA(Ile)-lysidine synthase